MADTKISELPVATAIASPDVAPIVQGGVTKQADVSLFNNLVASLILRSSGDSNDPVTHPYTVNNSGIIVKDANDMEVFRLWATDPVNDQSLYIGAGAGANAIPFPLPGSDSISAEVVIGYNAMSAATSANDNVAIGANAGGSSLITGASNVFVGYQAGASDDVNASTSVGFTATVGGDSSVAIGAGASAGSSGFDNSIAIGYQALALNDANSAHIGNSSIANAYFGEGNAILHGKGDAIVFPDSDPHVAGAAYWVLGVLTRSAG